MDIKQSQMWSGSYSKVSCEKKWNSFFCKFKFPKFLFVQVMRIAPLKKQRQTITRLTCIVRTGHKITFNFSQQNICKFVESTSELRRLLLKLAYTRMCRFYFCHFLTHSWTKQSCQPNFESYKIWNIFRPCCAAYIGCKNITKILLKAECRYSRWI